MTSSVFMAELSWVEYRRRLVEEDAIALLPVGAVEQHGPHLPLGADALLATEMARRAAEQVGGIVAPTLSYGYKSQPRTGGGNHFCGTTSLDGANLAMVVHDVIKELGRHGAKKVAVIDGHFENQMFLTEGVDLALRDLRYDGITDLKVLKMRYCETIKPKTLQRIFPRGFPGLDLEHAGVLETSMLLYLFPHLVEMDKMPADPPATFPPYDVYPTDTRWIPPSGVLSPAKASSAEIGKLLVDEFVDLVVRALRVEFRSTQAKKASRLAS